MNLFSERYLSRSRRYILSLRRPLTRATAAKLAPVNELLISQRGTVIIRQGSVSPIRRSAIHLGWQPGRKKELAAGS